MDEPGLENKIKRYNIRGKEGNLMTALSFRQAMGQFATGVTVITTLNDAEPHGMTANGFMSISLDPELVAISIGHKAATLNKIKASNIFGVSILQSEQIDISKRFAGQIEVESTFEFEYVDNFPLIPNSIMRTVCEVVEQIEAGDHTIFLGKPKLIEVNEGNPLLFYQGKYREVEELEVIQKA